MSYHIIDISTPNVSLSVKDGQLVCRNPDDSVRKLPIEDIGSILINSFSAQLHSSFVIEAAKRKVAVILCERFRPVSLVLPVQRASNTILTRAQIQAPMRLLRALWLATIDAKCANQYDLVSRLFPEDEKSLADFRVSMKCDAASKEGNCARIYWALFSRALGVAGFRRLTQGDGLNSLLNYAYAVLLLRIEQKLLSCGLDPLYGMGHVPRERSLPLAYDIMEPFRPAADELVFNWVKESGGAEESLQIGRPYKTMIHGLMDVKHAYRTARSLPLDNIAELAIRSYRTALTTGKAAEYKPWIRRSSRWAG
ncbi:MAG: type II CRISPR-associated endonuclease Cas1 [Kiritimatiellae bacterium]|nr:type II CRISPR-associated endonuclease Cas1 [Kiritimatiellia bacterium]